MKAVVNPAGNIARLDGSPRMPPRVSLCPVKRGILRRLEILNELDVFCPDPAESLNKVRNQHKCKITNAPVFFLFLNSCTQIGMMGTQKQNQLVGLFSRKRGMCQMYTFFFP